MVSLSPVGGRAAAPSGRWFRYGCGGRRSPRRPGRTGCRGPSRERPVRRRGPGSPGARRERRRRRPRRPWGDRSGVRSRTSERGAARQGVVRRSVRRPPRRPAHLPGTSHSRAWPMHAPTPVHAESGPAISPAAPHSRSRAVASPGVMPVTTTLRHGVSRSSRPTRDRLFHCAPVSRPSGTPTQAAVPTTPYAGSCAAVAERYALRSTGHPQRRPHRLQQLCGSKRQFTHPPGARPLRRLQKRLGGDQRRARRIVPGDPQHCLRSPDPQERAPVALPQQRHIRTQGIDVTTAVVQREEKAAGQSGRFVTSAQQRVQRGQPRPDIPVAPAVEPGERGGHDVTYPLMAPGRQQPGPAQEFGEPSAAVLAEAAQLDIAPRSEMQLTVAQLPRGPMERVRLSGSQHAAGDPDPRQRPVVRPVEPQRPRAGIAAVTGDGLPRGRRRGVGSGHGGEHTDHHSELYESRPMQGPWTDRQMGRRRRGAPSPTSPFAGRSYYA